MFEHRKKSCKAVILLVRGYAYNYIISKKLRESSFTFSLCFSVFQGMLYSLITTISEVIVSNNHEPLLLL